MEQTNIFSIQNFFYNEKPFLILGLSISISFCADLNAQEKVTGYDLKNIDDSTVYTEQKAIDERPEMNKKTKDLRTKESYLRENDFFPFNHQDLREDDPEGFKFIEDSSLFVFDQDSNKYPIVEIGDQWWMAENLRVTHCMIFNNHYHERNCKHLERVCMAPQITQTCP